MALEQRDKVIGSTTYRVTQLPAKLGRTLLVRITKLAGPALAAGITGVGETKAESADGALAVGAGEALRDLCMRLSPEEFGSILDEFAKYTVLLRGELEPRLADVFDDHFAGKYDEMLHWAAFCMEVNYQSFFGAAGGRAGLITRLTALFRPSPSPSTSTGTSTASQAAKGTPPG